MNSLDEVIHCLMDARLGKFVDEYVERMMVEGEGGISVTRGVIRK